MQNAIDVAPETPDHVPAPHETHVPIFVAPLLDDQVPATQLVQNTEEVAPADADHVPALHDRHPLVEMAPKLEDQKPALH